jgi:hypothetical protein
MEPHRRSKRLAHSASARARSACSSSHPACTWAAVSDDACCRARCARRVHHPTNQCQPISLRACASHPACPPPAPSCRLATTCCCGNGRGPTQTRRPLSLSLSLSHLLQLPPKGPNLALEPGPLARGGFQRLLVLLRRLRHIATRLRKHRAHHQARLLLRRRARSLQSALLRAQSPPCALQVGGKLRLGWGRTASAETARSYPPPPPAPT